MNKTFMQSVRTCYSLHILMFLKVVWVHYNVIYVTFSTILLKLLIFCKKVSFDKIFYMCLTSRLHVFKRALTEHFKTANRHVIA